MLCLLPAAAGLLVATLWAGSARGAAVPQAITQTEAEYPAWARGTGIATEVELRVLVGRDGRVRDVHVIPYDVKHDILTRQMRASFDSAAVRAVRRWVFRPASRGGRRVAASLVIHMPFEDPGSSAAPAQESPAPADVFDIDDSNTLSSSAPTRVDELPVVLFRAPITWPRPTLFLCHGMVRVEVRLDTTGRVMDAHATKSEITCPDSMLEADVIAGAESAARRWLFDPARGQGRPTSVRVAIPFRIPSSGREDVIFGRVVDDSSRKPIQSAPVIALSTKVGDFTDAWGWFVLEGLPRGSHVLQAQTPCHERGRARIEVGTDRVRPVDLLLSRRPDCPPDSTRNRGWR